MSQRPDLTLAIVYVSASDQPPDIVRRRKANTLCRHSALCLSSTNSKRSCSNIGHVASFEETHMAIQTRQIYLMM